MNVKDLKAALAGLPDDAPVLLSFGDHSYYELRSVGNKTALKDARGAGAVTWTEDIFIGNTLGERTEYGVRVAALCLT